MRSDSLPIAHHSSLYLRQLEIGPMENFIYLIGDAATKECVIVDPAWDISQVLRTAEKDGMKVVGALATHHHYDHTNGIGDLLTKIGCKVYIHKDDAPYLKDLQNEITKVDSGHKLKVGNIEITFIHTPGHTPGSQCFLIAPTNLPLKGGEIGRGSLVSGDTLFINACGRCDLPGGNAEQLYESLQRLAKLDENVVLFPGHNYADEPTSTIGQEKRHNPYLQAHSLKDFLGHRLKS